MTFTTAMGDEGRITAVSSDTSKGSLRGSEKNNLKTTSTFGASGSIPLR
ncbi:MAG: hypothetical protein ACXWP4_07635 [Polyangiales bacterium]